MNIQNLINLVGTPGEPVETGYADGWLAIEQRLGSQLPDDYKDYINTYGTGLLYNFIRIHNVFSSEDCCNLEEMLSLMLHLRNYNNRNRTLGIDVLYTVFPETGGVLPVGNTVNGDWIFWRTQGSPNNWTIIVQRVRSDFIENHDVNLIDFLLNVANPDIDYSFFSKLVEVAPFQVNG
jgi:hypothetical protein